MVVYKMFNLVLKTSNSRIVNIEKINLKGKSVIKKKKEREKNRKGNEPANLCGPLAGCAILFLFFFETKVCGLLAGCAIRRPIF
jgi:hypothetical protein